MKYKLDWEETKQRYEAWWRREKMDRPLLWLTCPKSDVPDEVPPPAPEDIEARWTDLDYLSASIDHPMRRTFYAAESVPVWSVGYPGHATMPTFYGCPFTLAETTGWHDPILTGETLDVSGLTVDRECKWWKWGDEMLARARAESEGKCLAAIGAIFGCGDTLAMVRGNERMLYDLMDDPAGVRDAELKFMDDWIEVFDHQTGILTEGGREYGTWFPIWAPGKFYPTQCDVAYGISLRSFRECFVPALEKQTEYLDHALYHLDGTGAFHLVEEVCKIDGIGAVQVLPGTGQPPALHFLDTCQTVQRMGKNLWIFVPPEEIPDALDKLSSRGLMFCTGARDEAHAQEIIETTARLAVDRG